jgi:hypothetical protein
MKSNTHIPFYLMFARKLPGTRKNAFYFAGSICYKHSFSLPDAPEIWYVLREKASNSVSERKVLPNEDGSSL